MMTYRDIWLKAAVIVAEHGELTADHIIDQLAEVLDDGVAVEDWRRVAAAVDHISGAKPQ